MAPDWRKHKMSSAEGSGKARAAWDDVPGSLKETPGTTAGSGVLGVLAREGVEGALGFWMLWHIHGGFEGLRRFGMSRSVIYKKIARFRTGFGEHPDDFSLPGVTIDVAAYWEGAAEAEARRQQLVAEQATIR